MSSADHLQLPEKRPGDEPFESETEVEDKSSGKGIIGTAHVCTWGQYCEDDLTGMVVRGSNFMSDKKKVDCTPPIYKLMHLDMFKTKQGEDRCAHYAASKDSWVSQRYERLQAKKAARAAAAGSEAAASAGAAADASSAHSATSSIAMQDNPLAPVLIINFLIPGSGHNLNLVLYFARRIKTAEELRKIQAARTAAGKKPIASRPPNPAASYTPEQFEADDFPHDLERLAAFDHLLKQFIEGSDEFRDGRLKIVPRIAEGSWVVKKSIGRVPAILGKKVKQFYYRNAEKNYLEIDADLGTSMMAGKIISMIKGTCKGLVVDLSFLLQGEDKTELPEALLGGVRMIKADLDKLLWRDENVVKNPMVYDV